MLSSSLKKRLKDLSNYIPGILLGAGFVTFSVKSYNREKEDSATAAEAERSSVLSSTESLAFFNRVEEQDKLRARFNAPKKDLIVLMGPLSVGKTALVSKVLLEFPNSAYLDLRSLDSKNPQDSLYSLFRDSVISWESKVSALELSASDRTKSVKAILRMFLRLLKDALEEFHKWSFVNKGPAVLVIDEANRLEDVYAIDHEFVTDFLSTLVQFSKQNNKVSVVLATSDSFFTEWLSQVGVGQHCITATLGDLPKEEAKAFFNLNKQVYQNLIPNFAKKVPEFDPVFNAVGGRMLSITRFLNDPLPFDKLPRVARFSQHLLRHCNPSNVPLSAANMSAGVPRWTEKEFVGVVRAIVSSPQHAVPAHQLIRLVSDEKVLSDLVKFNVLCFRPDCVLARDLSDLEHPLYTFPFPEDTIAARRFLERRGEEKQWWRVV